MHTRTPRASLHIAALFRMPHPCRYVCPLCVISWEWDDEEGLLVWSDETGSWALGVPGADEGLTVTRDILAELLPHSATVQTAVEFKSAELVWDLNQIPAEGVFQGTYTLTASLADTPEGPYALVDGVLFICICIGSIIDRLITCCPTVYSFWRR